MYHIKLVLLVLVVAVFGLGSTNALADMCDDDPDCDRITVTGTQLFLWMGMGLSSANVSPPPVMASISPEDVFEIIVTDIPRSPNRGDDTVNCASEEPVRQGEAGNQAGPYIDLGSLRDAFRIHYGNGESELFILTELSTMGFKPVPGTCS